MSTKYKTYPGGVFFVTLTVVDWITLFNKPEFCNLIVDNLNYCSSKKRLEVFACVIMPNHLHMIAGSEPNLNHILGDFKGYTCKELVKLIKSNPGDNAGSRLLRRFHRQKSSSTTTSYQIWQGGNHPIALQSKWIFEQKLNYLLNNPVKAGLSREPQEYIYSTAHSDSKIITVDY